LGRPLSASSFRYILREVSRRANVYVYKDGKKKAVWPHLLRHSRIAEFKRNKKKYHMSDDDICNVSGHRDRRMLDVYGKITMADTNEKLLAAAGLVEIEEKAVAKVVKCRRCGQVCAPLDKYCGRCTFPLDEGEVLRLAKEKEELGKRVAELERVVKKFQHPKILEVLEREAKKQ